ncbi:hypothetical protein [Pedosphaera parvula]|uniref:ABM domain-containing protein n=1 Tax=Pedosphaera parvula (strain Ellin514) TaxID=320771 RepID=B9XG61_PEDPL|nr:hypothetical protein [Pedosphaera parvula]EEF61223.1 conserved hypothetical protein [Pedosphaera parvula Ellin514]
MFASIRRYKATAPAEAAQLVREGLLPFMGEIEGFEGYYCLDFGNGEMASVSLYDTRAGAEQSNQLAKEWGSKHTVSLVTEKAAPQVGEVVAHRLAPHAIA